MNKLSFPNCGLLMAYPDVTGRTGCVLPPPGGRLGLNPGVPSMGGVPEHMNPAGFGMLSPVSGRAVYGGLGSIPNQTERRTAENTKGNIDAGNVQATPKSTKQTPTKKPVRTKMHEESRTLEPASRRFDRAEKPSEANWSGWDRSGLRKREDLQKINAAETEGVAPKRCRGPQEETGGTSLGSTADRGGSPAGCRDGGSGGGGGVEVRAASGLPAGLLLGPGPADPFRLSRDLLHDDAESEPAPRTTVWVGLKETGVRVLEVQHGDGSDSASSQSPPRRDGRCWAAAPAAGGPDAAGLALPRPGEKRRSPGTLEQQRGWVAAVQPARDCHQQNVEAIQDASGRIFYQTSREVARGETLHVWFSDVTAHALNVPVLTPNNIRGGANYVCTKCFKSFRYPNVLKSHVLLRCGGPRSSEPSAADDFTSVLAQGSSGILGSGARVSTQKTQSPFRSPARDFKGSSTVIVSPPASAKSHRKTSEHHSVSPTRRHEPGTKFPEHFASPVGRRPSHNAPPLEISPTRKRCRGTPPRHGSTRDRPQASPDSTTPENPAESSGKGLSGGGETSAFTKPQSKSQQLRTNHMPPEESRSVVSPMMTLHSPRENFPSGTQAHPGVGFMGQLFVPRPRQLKYSALDGYALRYLYPEQLGNMAAAAALARYQQAMTAISRAPGVGMAIPGAQILPTVPYIVPRPPPAVPPASTPIRHCTQPPPTDPRQSPEVSPTNLPFFPMPSDKEGEPLDLLPRSLYMNKGGRKGHLCIYCGKFYSRKYGLKIHLRTHTGYKPLKCKVCLRPFGDPSNLNKHIRLHADGETPYRCKYCGKVLVRRRDLERHIKSRHPAEADKEGLMDADTDGGTVQPGTADASGTLSLQGEGATTPQSREELLLQHQEDSDSCSSSYAGNEEEEEEIEVVELENQELGATSLRLDVRC